MLLNIVVVINESPWGSTLTATALRVARGCADAGHCLIAVFFREDGVYNCIRGTATDEGLEDHAGSWVKLNRDHQSMLMVCKSSAARRLSEPLLPPFREAGLVELVDLIADCDRVITF